MVVNVWERKYRRFESIYYLEIVDGFTSQAFIILFIYSFLRKVIVCKT